MCRVTLLLLSACSLLVLCSPMLTSIAQAILCE